VSVRIGDHRPRVVLAAALTPGIDRRFSSHTRLRSVRVSGGSRSPGCRSGSGRGRHARRGVRRGGCASRLPTWTRHAHTRSPL
jgi:hypothetical protein